MTNIYILKLQSGKYYVGKTDNIEQRKLTGFESFWTKRFKPISIEQIISDVSDSDEDKYTKEYMAKYGINNVRGGSYVTEELDEVVYYHLNREIWTINNLCSQCGRRDHFIKNCKHEKDVNGNYIFANDPWMCEYCDKEFKVISIK